MVVHDGESVERFVRSCEPFLGYLARLSGERRAVGLQEIIAGASGAQNVAVVAVDVVKGFCRVGALSSERVGAIVPPIVRLFAHAHEAGVTRFALVCEGHVPDAVEFHQFAPHCVAGTEEAEPVDELSALPFAAMFHVIRKNSISPWFSADNLSGWLRQQEQGGVNTVIAVGDCTDLCLHQFALGAKLSANEVNQPLRVIVPADAVQTYDLPVDAAARVGAMPHDGDLLHEVFLYHLALNGIEVVSRLTA